MDDAGDASNSRLSYIEDTRQQLRALEQTLKSLGSGIKPRSRLDLYRRELAKFENKSVSPSRISWTLLAYGARDLFEISFICEKLKTSHDKDLIKELPRLLRGASMPTMNNSHEDARNIQYQLFRAAEFIHSGFDVVLTEPDITFILDNTNLGIAVKRPTKSNFQECVHKGVKQLKEQGLRGFLSISLDRFAVRYIPADNTDNFDDTTRTILKTEFGACAKTVHREIDQSHVIGINFGYCGVGRIGSPWNVAFHTISEWLPRSDDAIGEAELVKRVLKVLKTPISS